MMGAKHRVCQGVYRTEYIPFEHVLKSNFLLHEQVQELTSELEAAQKVIQESKVAIDESRSELAKVQEVGDKYVEEN